MGLSFQTLKTYPLEGFNVIIPLENLSQSGRIELTRWLKPKQSIRCFYSQKEDVSCDIQTEISSGINEKYQTYMGNLDFSKFRDTADPAYIFNMLIWMADGCLHARQMEGKPIALREIVREFGRWTRMFKQIAYKEEYQ